MIPSIDASRLRKYGMRDKWDVIKHLASDKEIGIEKGTGKRLIFSRHHIT